MWCVIATIITDSYFVNSVLKGLSKTGNTAVIGPSDHVSYNVCYGITNDDIEIVVTYAEEDKTCRKNNAAHLLQAIEDALLDMRTLLE